MEFTVTKSVVLGARLNQHNLRGTDKSLGHRAFHALERTLLCLP